MTFLTVVFSPPRRILQLFDIDSKSSLCKICNNLVNFQHMLEGQNVKDFSRNGAEILLIPQVVYALDAKASETKKGC